MGRRHAGSCVKYPRMSSPLPLLAHVSPLTDGFGRVHDANDALTRMVDHLRGNNVALDQTMLTIGKRLNVNVQAENFGDDQEANRLLTREYRKGFEVPARF